MKNKPVVIQYQDLDGSFHDDKASEGPSVKYICLRLDARSRKKLVDMVAATIYKASAYKNHAIQAEAVLSDLEKLAEL